MTRHYAKEYYVYLGKVRTWCNVLVVDNGKHITKDPSVTACIHCVRAYNRAKMLAQMGIESPTP